MLFKKHKQTIKDQSRAITSRDITIYGLMFICIALTFAVLLKKPLVVVVPENLNGSHEITKGSANAQYKEDWGLAFAELLGNTTPQNIGAIVEIIKPYLHPTIYNQTITGLKEESHLLQEDQIITYFKVLAVRYQHSRDLVYVTGAATTEGTIGSGTQQTRTYEFRIGVDSYRPSILSFRVYEGEPRLKGDS